MSRYDALSDVALPQTKVSGARHATRILYESWSVSQGNIQVTSGTPQQARSESTITVNPANPSNLVAASKKFSNPLTYRFTMGLRVSFDGGEGWQDASLPTLPEWGSMVGSNGQDAPSGMTDPAVAFDHVGNAFMVGEPIQYATNGDINTVGMYVYKSINGGLNWSAPVPLHIGDLSDDKSWIACDNTPTSPHFGNVYIVWGAGSPLRFARSTNHGQTWTGVSGQPPGSTLVTSCFAPEVSIGLDGTVHVVWFFDGEDSIASPGTTIEYVRSTDGGATFEPQRSIVSGVHGLRGNLPETNGWPHFAGATFRVITVATGCGLARDPLGSGGAPNALAPSPFIVAWSDFRDGAARIYYRMSSNGGASFDGPSQGQALLGGSFTNGSLHHFHPQIVSTGSGIVGCAYYEFGPKAGGNRIDVKLSASFDLGITFDQTATITSKPWDPSIDAPFSHGDPQVTFIGEYFGLDADMMSFNVLWTDTRTGVQELFYSRVETEKYDPPAVLGGVVAQIISGVVQDGGGLILVGGHLVPIPPRGPIFELSQALIALDAAGKMQGPVGARLTRSVFDAIGSIAQLAGQRSQV